MAFHIDLNTRILTKDHGAFIARPGEKCRHFADFANIGAIGPDLPGVRIDPKVAIDEQNDLGHMLKRAMIIRKWAAMGRSDDDVPEAELGPYVRRRRLPRRSQSQFISILKGYFERAQKGDLIVIPPQSYQADAILAEFRDGPQRIQYNQIPRRYGNFEIPTRRFKVLNRLPKRLLPADVIDIISKPNAFVQVGKTNKEDLYHLAYGSFTVGGDFISRFEVTEESYNFDDDLYFAAFVKFVAANTKSVTIEGSQHISPIRTAAFEELGKFAPELKSNVNSPGFLSLTSPYSTPLVASVMFAIALQIGPDAIAVAQDEKITLGNSKAPANDECTARVFESTINQLKLFELDDWADACEMARKAERNTGLKPEARIQDPGGARK